ncbi:hypothetical protein [Limnoglobus roseus]|uniref:Uncharacterized protein n=1 Tax=Limnoglobus roseus TaxID=2598579 RepID=A0A5C1A9M3_9BACT|nr:hypothetical protein [Limnoglobus roseus]QEL15901.1 hypothetical protein PX52LOC_02837 [Limnoglobus roseus]
MIASNPSVCNNSSAKSAEKKPYPQASGAGAPQKLPDHKIEVVLRTEEHAVVNEAVAALARHPAVYQCSGALVRVAVDADEQFPDAERKPKNSPTVVRLSKADIRRLLTEVATVRKWQHTRGGELMLVDAHPTDWLTEQIRDLRQYPGVRHLQAISPYPVLLPSGEIATTSGYHADVGLYITPTAGASVAVPVTPTGDEVRAAAATLLDLVADFPFQSPADRSAWLAALLTPLAWHAYCGNTPMAFVDGNANAVGKTKLMDLISIILCGAGFDPVALPETGEEMRKVLTTLSMHRVSMALFDNVKGRLDDGGLEAALTSPNWGDRALGGNTWYSGPMTTVFFGTGNNAQYSPDMGRRLLQIRLDSPDERPERRQGFRHPDLEDYARRNRSHFLSAALTILRGWHVAGRPKQDLPRWGSFEPWSAVVRQAVVFAGQPDPAAGRDDRPGAVVPEAAAMTRLLALWDNFGTSNGVTTLQIINALKVAQADPKSVPPWAVECQWAVEELCPRADSRQLGVKFRQYHRRNFGNLRLEQAGTDRTKTGLWVVKALGPAPATTAALC